MSFIRRSIPHAAGRQHILPSLRLQPYRLPSSRRNFATERPTGQEKTPRWLVSVSLLWYIARAASHLHLISFNRLLVSIGLGLPISFYLWQRGGTSKVSPKAPERSTEPRGATKEYSQRSEGGQDVPGSSGYDVVRISFPGLVINSLFRDIVILVPSISREILSNLLIAQRHGCTRRTWKHLAEARRPL